ncbi:MAG: MFS transporter, partial [Clostridia bacterium]|nr:MFS transporter [Clostridia bacterium]
MKKRQPQLDANGHRKFGWLDKLAYAAGDFGCNMSFALKSTHQTFWLAYMLLDNSLLSILVIITQIWDAINDPLIGAMIDADKRNYRLGKFKTYILIGAIGLTFAGALSFIPVPQADTWLKAVLFIAGYIFWDAFYTVANVPYGSMLSLVSPDEGDKAQLSTWRSIGSMIGNMIPMMILPSLMWKDIVVKYDGTGIVPGIDDQVFHTNPETGLPYEIGDLMISPDTLKPFQELQGMSVFIISIVMGVLGLLSFLFMIKAIRLRVDENSVKLNEKQEKFNILKAAKNFCQNRPALGATIAAMGMFLGMNSASTATSIMFASYFGMPKLSGVASAIGFIPMLAFIPFIKKIVAKYGKKEASFVGTLVSCVGAALMFVFPAIPNRTVGLVMYIIALAIFGIGMGTYTCVSWALMGDAIEYNEWKTGKREEGTVYSLHSFFRKLAQGVGPAAVIGIMGALGYVSSKGVNGQTSETVMN